MRWFVNSYPFRWVPYTFQTDFFVPLTISGFFYTQIIDSIHIVARERIIVQSVMDFFIFSMFLFVLWFSEPSVQDVVIIFIPGFEFLFKSFVDSLRYLKKFNFDSPFTIFFYSSCRWLSSPHCRILYSWIFLSPCYRLFFFRLFLAHNDSFSLFYQYFLDGKYSINTPS